MICNGGRLWNTMRVNLQGKLFCMWRVVGTIQAYIFGSLVESSLSLWEPRLTLCTRIPIISTVRLLLSIRIWSVLLFNCMQNQSQERKSTQEFVRGVRRTPQHAARMAGTLPAILIRLCFLDLSSEHSLATRHVRERIPSDSSAFFESHWRFDLVNQTRSSVEGSHHAVKAHFNGWLHGHSAIFLMRTKSQLALIRMQKSFSVLRDKA